MADASHFLYQERDDFNVTLDVAGPGVLYFARYNHWHGSPWHYEVDGRTTSSRETSTADPLKPAENSVFLPERLFPNPLTWTWSVTKGADLMWVPIPFERTFRMAYSRTYYGTGYYIYHQYVRGANLSQPIQSWDGQAAARCRRARPVPARRDGHRAAGRTKRRRRAARRDQAARARTRRGSGRRSGGPRIIRALEFSVPADQALAFSKARLRVTLGRAARAVDRRADRPVLRRRRALQPRRAANTWSRDFPMVVQYRDGRASTCAAISRCRSSGRRASSSKALRRT